MEIRPVHVASVLAMIATAAIVTGCGGALQQQPNGLTSASTLAANPYAALFNLSPDPLQACIQQGGRFEVLPSGDRKCTMQIALGKPNVGTVNAGASASILNWSWSFNLGSSTSQSYPINVMSYQVPVLDGTMTTQQLMQSVLQPVVVLPRDTLFSTVKGSWGTRSVNGMYNCSSADLLGNQTNRSGVIAGNLGLNAGLIGTLMTAESATPVENFMLTQVPKTGKEITAHTLLIAGLNIVPSSTNINWKNDLCMNLQVQQLEIARCVNANNQTVKCPQ
ncbi:MAG: hypothetical protein KA715_00875 [Xanthomonadaceae bacterium]|nr:hypothetical protein [Xanthomonadaceae bacterium]